MVAKYVAIDLFSQLIINNLVVLGWTVDSTLNFISYHQYNYWAVRWAINAIILAILSNISLPPLEVDVFPAEQKFQKTGLVL